MAEIFKMCTNHSNVFDRTQLSFHISWHPILIEIMFVNVVFIINEIYVRLLFSTRQLAFYNGSR